MATTTPQVPVSTADSQGDRFIKIKLREALLEPVYGVWERRLAQQLDRIIDSNFQINPSPDAMCLRLRGVTHWHSASTQVLPDYYPSNKLHPSLKDAAHAWLEEHTEISTEKRMVSHSLSAILAASNHIEDYLDVLPSSLRKLCKSFQSMLPDPALQKRISPAAMQHLQFIHKPYLALMGQRYVLALIL